MGRHGTPDSDIDAAGAQPRPWHADSWDAAIGVNTEDSLYASGFTTAPDTYYQPVNDWSGVYTATPAETYAQAPASSGYYDYETYQAPQAQVAYQQPQPAQQLDQSYYESVYAAYAQPEPQPLPEVAPQPSTPTWDGPGWQDPYAPTSFYGEPQTYVDETPAAPAAPQQYYYGGYTEPEVSFHHPEFDTGQFEAVYAAPGSTEAEYDLLPDGGNTAYSDEYTDEYTDEYAEGESYDAEYGDDYEYDLDYDEEVAYEAEGYDYDDPEEAPVRSRSRSGAVPPSGRSGVRTAVRPSGASVRRRTLSTLTTAPAAVVGVAAVAVAAVGGLRLPGHTETTASDAPAPTSGLEQNLLQMRAASANLAGRASRAEQRTELSQQQALERQRLAEMAPRYYLPVADYMLTAGFGDSGARWSSLHTGQDFAVATGTRVVAVADGTVTDTGWAGAFGYRVVITHADGSQTWYCHLSYMKVRSGPVKAGQVIAYSGDTGNSTGPHLHFEYHPPGVPDPMTGVAGATTAVDPMPFLRSHGLVP